MKECVFGNTGKSEPLNFINRKMINALKKILQGYTKVIWKEQRGQSLC